MSHFSTVKTELRHRLPLLEALRDLGHAPTEGPSLVSGYQGQSVEADVAVPLADGPDIGFRFNAQTGAYELVADLALWKQPVPIERFLAQLTQRYALRTILQASTEEGFVVSEQQQGVDGSIELVVSRWDA
ncbi:DUF1257 domain-containing protein [Synechococcus sp. RSCCF101]|uniref:DUF1257 domain-containing protein n=1 Tax=Synechococcus sp. RSCCF101 TaxID=2511069 RepID=UPI0012465ED2|nr:DUF1257 domain-containing protein [Synechococcus sp. RSCCF101]QEY33096.1 DUF1257 domain-containing protein [Synechococcus sp. RSCCF101]